jgi:UDPglucose 6-dehydrogenase
MKIAVIGTGYVGLVTSTCFAESGNGVIGIDNDARKIDKLKSGKLPIYEPGLLELVQRNCRDGRLSFTTDLPSAILPAKLIFIAVGTPQSDEGDANLSAVWAVTQAIAETLKANPSAAKGKIVVVKSTVPVGTNRAVMERLKQHGCPAGVEVASNPEFLKEGAALDDFMKPDRVVVGVRSDAAGNVLKELYAPFLRTEHPFLVMTPESAEMTKYASNAMLATKISFINEMANLCDKLGADIDAVRKGMGHDQRIGFQFLFPGPGYGGSCFPKDVRAIIAMGKHKNLDLALMKSVDDVNELQKQVLVTKVRKHFAGSLKGKSLAIWGLAFKPKTDDIREAPALSLIDAMLEDGVSCRVHDPEAMPNVRELYGDKLSYCDRPYDCLDGAEALAIVTEWQEFRNPDFEQIKSRLKGRVLFDGRNLWDPKTIEEMGFAYYGIGRGRS